MKSLSIYIHIPFCVRKCLYCDFLSFPVCENDIHRNSRRGCESYVNQPDTDGGSSYVNSNNTDADERMLGYVDSLCREISGWAPAYKEYHVLSIFFGGGTPTLLPKGAVSRIMTVIRESYRLADDIEITIEMNPETAEPDKLKEYITCGINRLSIGLQSADDDELRRIGRIHDYRTFLRAYQLAREAGFRNINIDLMAALPGQSVESYRHTLVRAAALKPEHISAYSLILEEGTPMYERRQEFLFPTEDEDRDMYELTGEYLAACGYHRYEISNYARSVVSDADPAAGCGSAACASYNDPEPYECRHNKVYWQRGNYVGFGPGASSMVENVRWTNPSDMEQYRLYAGRAGAQSAAGAETPGHLPGPADAALSVQRLTVREQMEEVMFLGLRMMRGVDTERFEREFGQTVDSVYGEVIERLCAQGLLVREAAIPAGAGAFRPPGGMRLRLTKRGIDISNYVMAQFLFDETEG